MPKETRQARRARERRAQQQGRKPGPGVNWAVVGPIAVVVAFALVLIGFGLRHNFTSAGAAATPTEQPGSLIAGIGCDPMEQSHYHIHMHLAIYNKGKLVTIPNNVGANYNHDCLYWLHTHTSDGFIHFESPKRFNPKLSQFFAVWHQPISTTRAASAVVQPGEQMKVWVDGKPYSGNPANIVMIRHKVIQIDVGPPFVPFKKVSFGEL